MHFSDIEVMFNRAWSRVFDKKKLLFLFFTLLICGTLFVMSHTLASMVGVWVKLVLYFLPGFFISGVMLALGIFFARVYYGEMRSQMVRYSEVLLSSLKLLINVIQVALPFMVVYLAIWIVMGIFYLLREIPYVGESIGVILSFAPVVLILSSLFLVGLSLFTLFYVTPHIAFKKESETFVDTIKGVLKESLFSQVVLFFIALSPMLLMGVLLGVSGAIAQVGLVETHSVLKTGMQSFFMMLPFAAALTPIMLFFFNFSVESYNLTKKLARKTV